MKHIHISFYLPKKSYLTVNSLCDLILDFLKILEFFMQMFNIFEKILYGENKLCRIVFRK
jgi:hypothetical protein